MAENKLLKDRHIDIIFCIDGTGSMAPCLEKVKKSATDFQKDFIETMVREFESDIKQVNIKVITFRDYGCDGDQAMIESEFFDLTAGDSDEYAKHIADIVADGGGDDDENGLESLALAMKSDWKSRGTNDRQVIVLFTDADAHELGKMAGVPGYPADMVDMQGLLNLWACADQSGKLKERCKRLVMFAPASTKYETLQKNLVGSVFIPTEVNNGLDEISYQSIMSIIGASVVG